MVLSFTNLSFREYPEIESESEVVRYKKLLKHEMDTYDSLRKSKHVHTYEKFTKHEKEMRKLEMGSAEYLKMYRKVLDDYRIECGRGYLKYKRELIECKTRNNWFDSKYIFFGRFFDYL